MEELERLRQTYYETGSVCKALAVLKLSRRRVTKYVSELGYDSIKQYLSEKVPITRLKQEKIAKIVQLYKKHKSYEKVGKILQVTRSRVGQIIKEAKNLRYIESEPPLDVEKFVRDALNMNMKQLRHLYRISRRRISSLYKQYNIIEKKNIKLKESIVQEYVNLVKELNYHPTTTYLTKYNRSLYGRILWHWGSINLFRKRALQMFPELLEYPIAESKRSDIVEKFNVYVSELSKR